MLLQFAQEKDQIVTAAESFELHKRDKDTFYDSLLENPFFIIIRFSLPYQSLTLSNHLQFGTLT